MYHILPLVIDFTRKSARLCWSQFVSVPPFRRIVLTVRNVSFNRTSTSCILVALPVIVF
jgi:hypothetical protein